jgi:signal transduction histidine kinase
MVKLLSKVIFYSLQVWGSLMLITLLNSCAPKTQTSLPRAQKGILDLRKWNFIASNTPAGEKTLGGFLNLDGEWEFYWENFLTPDSFPNDKLFDGVRSKEPGYINVPGSWNSYQHEGREVGGDGFATYHLRILTDEKIDLSIRLKRVWTAYKIYANGLLLSEVGRLGINKPDNIPKFYPQVLDLPHPIDGKIDIVIHISNFYHRVGGLRLPIQIGEEKAIQALREKSLSKDLILSGSLLIMGLYHLGLFFFRKKDKSPLYFGLLCILIAMDYLLEEESYLQQELDWLSFEWGYTLEYLTYYLGYPVFVLFVRHIFPDDVNKIVLRLILYPSYLLTLLVLFTPVKIYSQANRIMDFIMILICIYMIYLLVLCNIRKREGARTFLLGFFIFSLFIINDLLYSNGIIHTGYYRNIGFFFFIFFQAFLLSKKFSESFEKVEKFSDELKVKSERLEDTTLKLETLNKNLETKVSERTRDLEVSKQELESLNNFTKLINSTSDAGLISRAVFTYLSQTFGLNIIWTLMINKNTNEIYSDLNMAVLENEKDIEVDFFRNFRYPLEPSLGTLYRTYKEKVPLYIPDFTQNVPGTKNQNINQYNGEIYQGSKVDIKILIKGKIVSTIQIPLILGDEVIGILNISTYKQKMNYSRDELEKLIRFGNQISGVLHNSELLKSTEEARRLADREKENALNAQMETEIARKEIENLNEFTKHINSTSDLTDIFKKIHSYIHKTFRVDALWIPLINIEKGIIYTNPNNLCISVSNQELDYEYFQNFYAKLDENLGTLYQTYKTKIPLYIKNIKDTIPGTINQNINEYDGTISQGSKTDFKIVIKGKFKSILQIPLLLQNEVIGFLCISSYNQFVNLEKEEIEKLVRFANQITGVILNARLLDETRLAKQSSEKALDDLKATQSQLIEAERLASLGQLVGGVAHEINNPIGVIRSNSELIAYNISLTMQKVPMFIHSLQKNELDLFQSILEDSLLNKQFLSTKEERQKKKEIKKELEELLKENLNQIEMITEQILVLRIKPPYKDLVLGLGEAKFVESLNIAQIFINQSNSIGSIEIAVEKSSRVVFALRNYLNTEMHLQRKKVDLIVEVEKALHVYDNYILGKVSILKEFPNSLEMMCIPENLLQVWKNIIFNAVQAMYLTEKRMEIKISKENEIPERILNMKSSYSSEASHLPISNETEWILVSFLDSGMGIPEDLQEKLFSPFFTTKALGEGIGLGLYISKKIIHEHGGRIFFQSKEGFTEFVIGIPFAKS